MYHKNRIHKAWKCQPPNSHSVHSWALERWAECFCKGYDLISCAFGNPAHINPLFKIELKYISDTYSIVWTRQWFPEGFLWCLSFHLNLVPKNIDTSGHVVFIIWMQLGSNLDKKKWSHFLSRQLVEIFIGQVVVFNLWPQSRWNMKRDRSHLIWDQQRRLAFSLSQQSSNSKFYYHYQVKLTSSIKSNTTYINLMLTLW